MWARVHVCVGASVRMKGGGICGPVRACLRACV